MWWKHNVICNRKMKHFADSFTFADEMEPNMVWQTSGTPGSPHVKAE